MSGDSAGVISSARCSATGRGRQLLDVGAGNGYFVHLARSEFGLRADGLEISAAEANYARDTFGLELLRGDLSSITATL